MRITLPAFGTLHKAGPHAEGKDLEAMSLSDIFALTGAPPSGIKVEKEVLEYTVEGTAIVELTCEDILWLAQAKTALESRNLAQLRSAIANPRPFIRRLR